MLGFALLGLVLLAIPVAVVVLCVTALRQNQRLRELEADMVLARAALIDMGNRLATPRAAPEDTPEPDRVKAPEAQTAPQGTIAPDPIATPDPAAPTEPPAVTVRPRPTLPPPTGPNRAEVLVLWLRENWYYAVSALSLALAGVFLVQYSVENGLLPPTARVMAAGFFGLALMAGGEVIRRRYGDGEDSATAYLPSVFSGAGIVSLFGAVIAARMLYDLIGPGPAFVLLALVALIALVLGWFHGPLLATVGLLGGFAAPFLVGGASGPADWVFAYFAVLAALGLGIDTIRRWRWISGLTLGLAYGGGVLLRLLDSGLVLSFALYLVALLALAVLVPVRRLVPDHGGPSLLHLLVGTKTGTSGFVGILAFGASLASAAFLVLNLVPAGMGDPAWLTLGLLTLAALLLILASHKAPGLQEAALPPALALLALVGWRGSRDLLVPPLLADLPPETGPGWAVPIVLMAGGLITLAGAWRSLAGGKTYLLWALFAAGFAPATALVLELSWQPATRIGAYGWALCALALAGGMTALTPAFAKADGQDRTRAALFALSALGCIAFGLVIVLSASALTVALAALIPAAAWLDRRFDLPLMELAIAAAVATVGYRLVADPGLSFAQRGAWPDFLLAYGGALLAMIAGLGILRDGRMTARVMLDTGAWSAAGLLAALTLHRVLADSLPGSTFSHWSLGLHATIWLILMAVQLSRADRLPLMQTLRLALAVTFGLIAGGALIFAALIVNPLLTGTVHGWPLLNTLAPAYLLPAGVLVWIGIAVLARQRWPQIGALSLAMALTALWAGLAIRHLWQGGTRMAYENGVSQPELYSYTLVLLILGGVVFYQALARRSDLLRRVGSVLIALAVAKVFLLDIAGLSGLIRVLSLVVLGLTLAGLAALNRWAQRRTTQT